MGISCVQTFLKTTSGLGQNPKVPVIPLLSCLFQQVVTLLLDRNYMVLRGFWSAFGLEMCENKTTKCQKNLSFLLGTFSTGCHRVTGGQNSNLTKSQHTIRRQRQEIMSGKNTFGSAKILGRI